MNTKKCLISIALFCTILFAQNLHIPPCGGNAHSTSVCRGYAMAVSLPGSYCPPGKVGDIDAVSSALFEPKPWDSTDKNGNKVPAGIYLLKMTAESIESHQIFTETRKMVLLK